MTTERAAAIAVQADALTALWVGLAFVAIMGALVILGICRGGHPARRRP